MYEVDPYVSAQQSSSAKKKVKKSSSVKSAKRKGSDAKQPASEPLAKCRSVQDVTQAGPNAVWRPTSGTAKPDRRRSASLCRITGLSHSLDEPHYFPSKSDFPYFGRRSSCHITYGHEVLGDNYTFPLPEPKGKKLPTDRPLRSSEWPYSNGQSDSKKHKAANATSNDLTENPSQLLKERFKQKNWTSEDEPSKAREKRDKDHSVNRSKSLKQKKRKSSLVTCNLTAKKTSKSDESIDVNNNVLEGEQPVTSVRSNSRQSNQRSTECINAPSRTSAEVLLAVECAPNYWEFPYLSSSTIPKITILLACLHCLVNFIRGPFN